MYVTDTQMHKDTLELMLVAFPGASMIGFQVICFLGFFCYLLLLSDQKKKALLIMTFSAVIKFCVGIILASIPNKQSILY